MLLDVPCSNTGVMRHRVDVKWRLREADLARHAAQQGALLAAGARLVAPGGRLVYSTCSLEPEENLGVVEDFLRAAGGRFGLAQQRASRPWESGCDGGSAFLLRQERVGSGQVLGLGLSRRPNAKRKTQDGPRVLQGTRLKTGSVTCCSSLPLMNV